jgi:flagellar assembly factor FliW
MTDADKHSLSFNEGDSTKVLVVMTIPENMSQMTVNLRAPVVLDITKATAAQIILQDKTLEVRTPAHEDFSSALSSFAVLQSASEAEERSERFNAVNVRTVVNQGFQATV